MHEPNTHEQISGMPGEHAGPEPQVQTPPVHESVASFEHERPHEPQFEGSRWTSTQLPSQHCWLPEHVRPHAPQFATVSRRVHDALAPDPQHAVPALQPPPPPQRQTPPMQVSPGPHAGEHGVSTHEPPVQVCDAAHAIPQPPQLLRSVCASTQAPPQQRVPPVHDAPSPHWQVFSGVPGVQVSPAAQVGVQTGVVHAPPTHAWPSPHAMPQPPQFASSLCPSTQAPPQQSAPAGHGIAEPPQRQVPVVQRSAVAPHWLLHAPQSPNALPVSMHAPSQHWRPPVHGLSGPQVGTHSP